MKNKILIVILCCVSNMNIGFTQCLSTDSLNLKWSKKKTYCQKKTKTPFSGCVSGWISCRETNLANIQELTSIIHDWNFSSQDSTVKDYWYSDLYIVGELNNGKEVGVWKFYGDDNILVGETIFEEKNAVKIIIYYPDGREKYRGTIPTANPAKKTKKAG